MRAEVDGRSTGSKTPRPTISIPRFRNFATLASVPTIANAGEVSCEPASAGPAPQHATHLHPSRPSRGGCENPAYHTRNRLSATVLVPWPHAVTYEVVKWNDGPPLTPASGVRTGRRRRPPAPVAPHTRRTPQPDARTGDRIEARSGIRRGWGPVAVAREAGGRAGGLGGDELDLEVERVSRFGGGRADDDEDLGSCWSRE